jgi:hypothetical protein
VKATNITLTRSATFKVIAFSCLALLVIAMSWRLTSSATQAPTTLVRKPLNTRLAASTSNSTTLDITQLGVNIKLDSSVSDATYTYKLNADGSQTAYISTTTLSDNSGGSCSAQNGPLVAVTKAAGTADQVFGATAAAHPVDNARVFQYQSNGSSGYIFITPAQSECSQNSTVQTQASQQESALINDFKSVQPDSSSMTL